ncbi:MAG TPA: phosphoribosylformylglycinamidine synthase subunit PurQ [Candidatus Peribacterales bacterium]|nr:phosphoribosylformylglycinamidine synthase subunit PurQ [Candidatus Peribacterales bacterium]
MIPRIAIVSFPGTNGDTENLRTFWRSGFDAFVFRWNDSKEKLAGVDGYFIGAGFAYEDRGRAGMVAARDPLFQFLHEEAEKGKVIVGNCNGCQVLVESELIPLGQGLRMCMARNTIREGEGWKAPGFLNEWVWVTPACSAERCATSDWAGAMHIPMAHGEGRFVTKDVDLIKELEKNDQIAFRYCDEFGKVSTDPSVTLNGSTGAIAGICNPAGNVVSLMPHPERTVNGDPYFVSMRKWIEKRRGSPLASPVEALFPPGCPSGAPLHAREARALEIFIDTLIVNNEERTVEQAGKSITPNLQLKQFRYLAPKGKSAEQILTTISHFNPNKEVAYVRSSGSWNTWNADRKVLEASKNPLRTVTLLRRDEPDVGAAGIGGGETGVCYSCDGISGDIPQKLQEIFANPHASILEALVV